MIRLRPATTKDVDVLWAWRNDPVTRQMSRSTTAVPWEAHVNWLRRSLMSPSRRLYVAEWKGEPVGTLRTDTDGEHVELSLTVAPSRRGQGIGTAILKDYLRQDVRHLVAEIKRENVASQHVFTKAGFVCTRWRDLGRWERPCTS